MKKRKIKVVLVCASVLLMLFAIYEILKIFAVFYSESTGTLEANISNWTIKVNETMISTGQVENFTVDTFNVSENEHVKQGKIAPRINRRF